MSKLDLNKVSDFQRAVVSPAANITALIAGELNPEEWAINEATFDSDDPLVDTVTLHVFESTPGFQAALSKVADKGGRRKIKYLFPYRDGQTTDDLGRRPQTFDLDIVFFGNTYQDGLDEFLALADSALPGTLTHPTRGDFRCVIDEYELIHANEARKSVALRVSFIEHNFDVGDVEDLVDDTSLFKKIVNNALKAFAAIDAAIAAINAAVNFAHSFAGDIQAYKNLYAKNLVDLNQTFNPPNQFTPADVNNDLAAIIPVNQGGTINPDGTPKTLTAQTVKTPNDPFASIPLEQLRTTTKTAIATSQAINNVNILRANLNAIIATIEASENGLGSLTYYDTLKDLKQTAILIQSVLESGLNSSRGRLISYKLPRTMSIREVAFANQVDLENVIEIEILNPSLFSTNFIDKGTVLRIAK